MPGLPLSVRDNTNSEHYHHHSRTAAPMCRESDVRLSAEEANAAEESLSVYCKPVELYNILQRRSSRNPSFLQKCLRYKLEAKRQRKIEITIHLSETLNTGVQVQHIIPLHIFLAKPTEPHSTMHKILKARVLTASNEIESRGRRGVNLILPEINQLIAKSSDYTILLVSCGEMKNSLGERNLIKNQTDTSYPANVARYCLWGEIPVKLLYSSQEAFVNLRSMRGAEMLYTVKMQSCFLEPCSLKVGSIISPKIPENPVTMQVAVSTFSQVLAAKESSPYNSYTYDNVPVSSLPQLMRLRCGNVLFNYKYFNNRLQKTEVTEDFACPFCLVQCGSFKGLRYHLGASHDLFNYEFWVTEEYQAVNVSVKHDIWISEVADGFDPRVESFFLCTKPHKRRRTKNVSGRAKNVRPHVLQSDPEVRGESFLEKFIGMEDAASSVPMPVTISPLDTQPDDHTPLQIYENGAHSRKEMDNASKTSFRENDLQKNRYTECNGVVDPSIAEGLERVASSPSVIGTSTATAQSAADLECFQQESGSNGMLQFAKTRKLSIERSDPRNRMLLQKRQFFHSHRAQPMAMEQVLSDRDSEDEVDDDIADFEDRRMLDDFVDVTKDEKQIMHLWNSFVRKQRVLADGHIPWACEAFSKMHVDKLVESSALMWCWRLFMIKLWNQSLLDGHTMDKCSRIIERGREDLEAK